MHGQYFSKEMEGSRAQIMVITCAPRRALLLLSPRAYSCMTHGVFFPLGALLLWNTSVFFVPTWRPPALLCTALSLPVDFQYPLCVARRARTPDEYLLPLLQKK
jgi:hypothetical protein